MGMIISSMLMVVFLTYHLYRILEAKPRPLPYKDQPILNGSVPLVSFLVPAWNDQRHIRSSSRQTLLQVELNRWRLSV